MAPRTPRNRKTERRKLAATLRQDQPSPRRQPPPGRRPQPPPHTGPVPPPTSAGGSQDGDRHRSTSSGVPATAVAVTQKGGEHNASSMAAASAAATAAAADDDDVPTTVTTGSEGSDVVPDGDHGPPRTVPAGDTSLLLLERHPSPYAPRSPTGAALSTHPAAPASLVSDPTHDARMWLPAAGPDETDEDGHPPDCPCLVRKLSRGLFLPPTEPATTLDGRRNKAGDRGKA
jgi:hypothetical protein